MTEVQGSACAKSVTGRMLWTSLFRRSSRLCQKHFQNHEKHDPHTDINRCVSKILLNSLKNRVVLSEGTNQRVKLIPRGISTLYVSLGL